jgi:hydrogenase nickel incorporation protein HypA/HybF
MHEVGLMQEALSIALDHAAQQRATRIERITMLVGGASGVDAESLRLAFDIVSHGTIAAGASLTVESIGVACYCARCCLTFTPPDVMFICPQCGNTDVEITDGQALQLGPIEMSSE